MSLKIYFRSLLHIIKPNYVVTLTEAQRKAEAVVIRVTHSLRKCNHEQYCLVLQPVGENLGNMKTEEEAWVMEKSNVISAEEERRPESVPAVVTRTRAG
jgi:hypothetical protein